MTRINLVHVKDLADQHLFAEWREIKMIPAKLRKNPAFVSIPVQYTMSTGHVRFFYNKLRWLHTRYNNLDEELRNRNYNISNTDSYKIFLEGFSKLYTSDNWEPSIGEIKINVDRISERLHQRPNWYRYYGDVYAPDFFIDRYNQQLLVVTIVG
jgi:deoxyribonuclease (pyrimidine dimer)